MKVLKSIPAWRAWRDQQAASLGFVPTMGALHAGHQALVQRCRSENPLCVASIFVNPTQFDRREDLDRYPRQQAQDLHLLEDWGVDAVFLPDYDSLYPDGFRYRLSESQLSQELCGKHRPGHFDGVLTIVLKLFHLVRPQRAYFGEKDWQQLELIRGMVDALFLDVEIVPCPIVREHDGLALSSRNARLNPQQRLQAPRLAQCLRQADSAEQARKQLLRLGFKVDYVEDRATGNSGADKPVSQDASASEVEFRRLAAAFLGDVRLIDNVPVKGALVDPFEPPLH